MWFERADGTHPDVRQRVGINIVAHLDANIHICRDVVLGTESEYQRRDMASGVGA